MVKKQKELFLFMNNTSPGERILNQFKGLDCSIFYPEKNPESRSRTFDRPFFAVIETAGNQWEWIEVLLDCFAKDNCEKIFLLSTPGYKSNPPQCLPLKKPVYPVARMEEILHLIGAGKRKKVLFVDDDHLALKAYKRFFSKAAWQFVTASSGGEALRILETESLSLIVTDIKMPGMHGVELVSKIRMINSTIPIFACSAYAGMKDDAELQYHQIEAFIEKPVDIERLKNKIDVRLGN